MYVATAGRNDPCPCGSNKKYKKCCLGAAPAETRDVEAIVNLAIERDDWARVEAGLAPLRDLLAPNAPLEYVRLLDHQVSFDESTEAERTRWTSGGWLRWCAQALAAALDAELAPDQRASLEMAIYLLRRFGAQSPVVELIAALQRAELGARRRLLEDALARHGLTPADLERMDDFEAWLARARPSVLEYPDWLVLRVSKGARRRVAWRSGIAGRVFEHCLLHLEDLTGPEVTPWLQLATLALYGCEATIEDALCHLSDPRCATDSERALFAAAGTPAHAGLMDTLFPRVLDERAAAGDFTGTALLRELVQQIRGG